MKTKHLLKLKQKADKAPDQPGCYLMRDNNGRIIYIGKAKSLKKRLQSYFRSTSIKNASIKNKSLIQSIGSFDIILLSSEDEAILTEGELIKQYQPYYNILWKDDKNFLKIKININSEEPTVGLCRYSINDGCMYFGPYVNSRIAKIAIVYIEKFFGFKIINNLRNNKKDLKDDLYLKFCIPDLKDTNIEDRKFYLNEVSKFLNGRRFDLIDKLKLEMKQASKFRRYEKASDIRDFIFHLQSEVKKSINVKKNIKIYQEDGLKGLVEIQQILSLEKPILTIECFDISNISGMYSVGSMVTAINGIPAPSKYRHFKIKSISGINDPASIAEIINRRYLRLKKESKKMPDLIIVDGGRAQLQASVEQLIQLGIDYVPIIGLAKKKEEIYWRKNKKVSCLKLIEGSPAFLVVTRLRDESHRFAISYHRKIRDKKTLESKLDSILNLGEYKKNILLSHFGSVSLLSKSTESELLKIKGIGPKTANIVYKTLR